MKYKNEIIIALIVSILVVFLKVVNVFQIENGLGNPFIMCLMILFFSGTAIHIQKGIDKNYKCENINYKNLDILKYICAILIIILHMRPFLNFSSELDLAFNNIITRICVPIFFLITGYFVAKKENDNPDYIKGYIKRTIPLYLIWSIIYIPIVISFIISNMQVAMEYLSQITIPLYYLIPLILLAIPIVILVALVYTGVYYHLWYFPAIILSLILLERWKKKFPLKYLLIISFFFLLFGATETYYGVLPFTIKQVISYYYKIFFTTRNFLFFGLFYVVLGYFIGRKKDIYSKYCFEKLLVCIFLLIFEAILLHDSNRLNSNILLSCVPLVYYLFISCIYISNNFECKFPFGKLSKYYYLIHPMIIGIVATIFNDITDRPFQNIFFVVIITHIISVIIIKLKGKYKKLVI